MSPEQARGQPVDKRTDIWAFGCVLFEMLTGATTFARPTATDTLAAVVGVDPDWASLPADTPASIRRLLTRCLQKDARRRLHDIADVRIELEDAMTAPAVAVPARRRWTRPAMWALSLGLVAAVAAAWLARDRFGRPSEPPPDTRVMRLTDLPGLEEFPAISPDGRSVAFTAGVGGRRQLFVQLITGGAPLQLTRDPVDHEYPRWSPDSSSIFYFSASRTRTTAGEHLGDPGTWRRATAGRQQCGRRRRQPDGWQARALQTGEERDRVGRRDNGRIEVRRGRRVRGRHVLPVSTVVA